MAQRSRSDMTPSIFSEMTGIGAFLEKVDILQEGEDICLMEMMQEENKLLRRHIRHHRQQWRKVVRLLGEAFDIIMLLKHVVDESAKTEEVVNHDWEQNLAKEYLEVSLSKRKSWITEMAYVNYCMQITGRMSSEMDSGLESTRERERE